MKKLAFVSAAMMLAGTASYAGDYNEVSFFNDAVLNSTLSQTVPSDLIKWKVGDTMNYNIGMMFGNVGTMVKSVTKDEGTAIWMRQDMNMMGQKEVVDVLLNKADGKVLKMLRNGQEQQIPDEQIEIISQDYSEVTVPAGKFSCMYVVAKSKSSSKIEVWINPKDTIMDGTLKQAMASQMGTVTLELTSFKAGQ